MNNTSALDVIIQPLCPGPAPATLEATLAVRAPLFMYASMSAIRCSSVGSLGGGGEAGAAAWARAENEVASASPATTSRRREWTRDFMKRLRPMSKIDAERR